MNVDGDWRLNSEGKVMKSEYRSGVRLDWDLIMNEDEDRKGK